MHLASPLSPAEKPQRCPQCIYDFNDRCHRRERTTPYAGIFSDCEDALSESQDLLSPDCAGRAGGNEGM
jgi:hypothetical protein